MFLMLTYNMSSVPRRRLYNFALGDGVTTVLTFNQTVGNAGATELKPDDNKDQSTRVASVALDMLRLTGPMSLMKVDVENMEPSFLRGARDTLQRLRPTLIIEIFPPQFKEVSGLLTEMNYEQRSDAIDNYNYVFAHKDTATPPR